MRNFASLLTNKTGNMRNNIKPSGFDEKLEHSIGLLKKAERLAFNYSDKGFYLAFSGGEGQPSIVSRFKISWSKI